MESRSNNLNILAVLTGAPRCCRSLAGSGHAARPAPCISSCCHRAHTPMRLLLICILLLSLPLAAASNDVQRRIHELETALSMLQQERQDLFQQFQILQEFRRHELQQESDIITQQLSRSVTRDGTVNYDDVQKRKQERFARIKEYTAQLDEIHGRYREIDSERQVLIRELSDLKRSEFFDQETGR
ncbi:MAG: hypothetical protein RQ714_03415 [Nitrosomonas sp.]|nr:hypothetical protein [Nitrosomonas sp.]